MEFVPGARVRARGLPWDVLAVEQLGPQQLLRLRCTAGDLRGLEWDFLHPAEQIVSEYTSLRPETPGPLALWRLQHQAALLEQIPPNDELLADQPGRIHIEPYQLVPLMRALELPRPRLLLADGVGLGKTVEAALIVCELIARRRAHRVLVASPAGPLLTQWEQELRHRFGLRFTPIVDSAALHAARRRLELGNNPFDATALCLTSLDFAKQEHVLEELERSAWDIAIIDEAHHCFGEASERDDTQRRRLAEVIARRSDGLLLLTATPHDGYDPHFASLIELLDPSLVDGSGRLIGNAYRRHVVRRLKSHIRDAAGAPMFRERHVIPVRIALDGADAAPLRAFHRALAALVAPRLRRAARQDDMDALAFVSLLKRSVSTIAACINTLRVVSDRCRAQRTDTAAMRKERARALRSYRRRVLRFGVLDAGAEADAAELEADGMAADLAAHEQATALASLIRLGERARAHDPKLAALCRAVREIRAATPGANILVYTEYADSQLAALHALRAAIDGEVLAISGLDPDEERARVAERCAEQDNIVLLSTDALAEGLNLQRRCWHLIHLDLPYNPNRLEQRNGRIDRYGQTHEPQIRYLYLAGTFEERLLLRLIAKYEQARARLDLMPETLGVTADVDARNGRLIAGFAERQASLFEEEASPIRTLDRAAEEENAHAWRELLREIDRAFEGYERIAVHHGWLQGVTDAALTAKAAALRRRGDGHVDLPDFVASAIRIDGYGSCRDGSVLQLPPDWIHGLEGLPGYDAAHRTLRITRDRDRLNDEAGRSLAYLGRAHPLVQRAIARAWRSDAGDSRVSVARAAPATEPALLLTFRAEMRGPQRIDWQRIIAVLVGRSLEANVVRPERWLRLSSPGREFPDDTWCRLFKRWAPRRIAEAECVATDEMQRLAAAFARQQQTRDRDADGGLRHWLDVRAGEICGAFRPPTGDLFGAPPVGPPWRLLADPLERLAAFVADGSNPPARRREANSVIELFLRRAKECDGAALSPPALHRLGMLMLVP